MASMYDAPWHKDSYDTFLNDRLPQLLAGSLPLAGYQVRPTGDYTCTVTVTLTAGSQEFTLYYDDLPQPDADGVFQINGQPYLIIPLAEHEALGEARIECVGEQLDAFIAARLGQPPEGITWDTNLARSWLPLEAWIYDFFKENAQRLDTTNFLSRHTHLRRIKLVERRQLSHPTQFGRVCPFEVPEGPNLGRVFSVASGAVIQDGKLVVVDDRPQAAVGLTASLIPLIEHNDPNRTLMGANMMRQALVPADPEPALVQTGLEPDAVDFWTGRNLLTAFVCWGPDTSLDGILVSESCARRMNYPYPIEPGDKLANRHGTKGVVSRVLADVEMPHLADGTPVELVFNFSGLHVRMNFGQIREALLGSLARAEGRPVVAAPFGAPSAAELHKRLEQAGLPGDGMQILRRGKGGPHLDRSSLVGWVYWNRLVHLAQPKMQLSSRGEWVQFDLRGIRTLVEQRAYENLLEVFNTRSANRFDPSDQTGSRVGLAVLLGKQALPPSPRYEDLASRLRTAGIKIGLHDERLHFQFIEPGTNQAGWLALAASRPHPWLRSQQLSRVGMVHPSEPRLPVQAFQQLVEVNTRLSRLLASHAPQRLVNNAEAQLDSALNRFFTQLLPSGVMNQAEPQMFSVQAVLAPGASLSLEQVGLPDDLAWDLFEPLMASMLGDSYSLGDRSSHALQTLDKLMESTWVLLYTYSPYSPHASLAAFRSVRTSGPVIRIHPQVCELLGVDFDGDQVSILLPITERAQREAEERLTLQAYLSSHPGSLRALLPTPDALWGLAHLGLAEPGRNQIAQTAGIEPSALGSVVSQDALTRELQVVLESQGPDAVIAALERLGSLGYESVLNSGASMSPFIGESLPPQLPPLDDDPRSWEAYLSEMTENVLSASDYSSPDLGVQYLAVKTRQRGRSHLPLLLLPRGPLVGIDNRPFIVRHSNTEGLQPVELFARNNEARQGLYSAISQTEASSAGSLSPSGFSVMARAMQSDHPGIIFARAAANRETDSLLDPLIRTWVGLGV